VSYLKIMKVDGSECRNHNLLNTKKININVDNVRHVKMG